MTNELSPLVPAALGFGVAVLVWAIGCAIVRKKKTQNPQCGICPKCQRTLMSKCIGFPKHGHAWCSCVRYWES